MLKASAKVAPARRLHGFLRRLSWGLADQAASSVSNFAITIYVAHVLGASELGAFSLAYVTYSFALNASRGLATDPLVVRFSGVEVPAWKRAVAGASATAGTVGLVSGAVVLAAAMLLDGVAQSAFIALGLVLPGLLLQDSWRYAFFAAGNGKQAFFNDMIWVLAMVPGIEFLRATGSTSVFSLVLVWGAAAAVAACAGPLQSRVMPSPSRVGAWLAGHRDLGFRYLAENTANSGSSQLRSYGVGIIAGLAAVGYVQAATTLMGPFLVVFMGLSLVTVPEAARILRRAPHRLSLFCLAIGVGLSIGAIAWGAFLLVALPRGLGEWLFPHVWRPAYPLVLPLTISVVGGCIIGGATSGLRALGAARRSLRAMIISASIFLACGLAGAAWHRASGAMDGAAVATLVGAAVWWWQLRTALREAAIRGRVTSRRSAQGRHRMVYDGLRPPL